MKDRLDPASHRLALRVQVDTTHHPVPTCMTRGVNESQHQRERNVEKVRWQTHYRQRAQSLRGGTIDVARRSKYKLASHDTVLSEYLHVGLELFRCGSDLRHDVPVLRVRNAANLIRRETSKGIGTEGERVTEYECKR